MSEARVRMVVYALLIATMIAVVAWLQRQPRATPRSALPALAEPSDATRFRADTWYLPAEPMLGFVEIPAGSFAMGSDPTVDSNAFENERWSSQSFQGNVELPTFYIGRYEVTVAQYRAFVEATDRNVHAATVLTRADHPVTNITWTDALAYAQWLDTTLRTAPTTPDSLRALLQSDWEITLPTEAQWEKAARGNDARVYPWGNAPATAHANYGSASTSVVGSLPCPNCAYALADMSGNVWEMTRSPLQSYPFNSSDEPVDPRADALFVMRGGSYRDQANLVRAAVRGGIDPGARQESIGFRLAMTKRQIDHAAAIASQR